MPRRSTSYLLGAVSGTLVIITAAFGVRAALAPPQVTGPLGRQSTGETLVPSGQVVRASGEEVTFPGRPGDAALSPDGKTLAVLSGNALLLLDPSPAKLRQTVTATGGVFSYAGLAWSHDGSRLFASTAFGAIHIYTVRDGAAKLDRSITIPVVRAAARKRVETVEDLEDAPPPLRSNSALPGGLAVNRDGTRLYVALNRANTLAEISLETDEVLRQIPVGVAPYGVLLSADGRAAYVSNWGGRRPRQGDETAYSSGTQVVVDPKTGIASTGTVSAIRLEDGRTTELEVGQHPCAMALDGVNLLVANNGSDTLSVIDTTAPRVTDTVSVHWKKELPLGSGPMSIAVSSGRWLVANAGNNAVAVISGARGFRQVDGFVPTGWYPAAVVPIPNSSRVAVANLKGQGARSKPVEAKDHTVRDHLGSVSFFDAANLEGAGLARLTREVERNNGWDRATAAADKGAAPVPVPELRGQRSVFNHVLYIIKENRTYDQVFGDMKEGNGDPSLVQFGEIVTPNHHALAREFALLDNFYCSGTVSADGHQWTNEAYASDYIDRMLGAGFPRSYPYEGSDPLAYASSGFLWNNALRHGKTFRCYGEFGQEIVQRGTRWTDFFDEHQAGKVTDRIRSATYVKSLKPYMHPGYPGFNMTVPDQTRADLFLQEFQQFEEKGELPHLMMLLLPDDHTAGVNPGHPTPRAMVADNDYALGRIVEAVTKSRFWKDTVIFVVEDDSQAGTDHVDGHRTVALAISPYTRRGAVVKETYTQVSMVGTIERILGLPPMNQLDLAAPLMTTCFSEQADLRPYRARLNRIPLNEMNPEPTAKMTQAQRSWLRLSLRQNFTVPDAADEKILNRIIWHSVKGYETPYPAGSAAREGGDRE